MPRFDIPATNVSRLYSEIETLNKKAAKLGCAPITIREVERRTVTIKRELGFDYDSYIVVVEVEGQSPKLNGWRLIAKVEPHKAGNIIKTVPGEEVGPRYRQIDMICEHCKTKRIRNETFVVRHDDGREVVVGRSCIKDFLGHDNPETLARVAEWDMALEAIMEEATERGWGRAYRHEEDVLSFVTLVAGLARHYGFVTRKALQEHKPAAFGRTTGQLAWDLSVGDRQLNDDVQDDGFDVIERDVTQATQAVEWIRGMEEPSNTYMYNLWVACKADAIDGRAAGIVASLIATYKRHIEGEIEKAAKPVIVRKHIGQVGDKITTKVKVHTIKEFTNDWGVTRLVRMEDADGNYLNWWASSFPNFDEGQEVTIKGTIKKLDEYNGNPITVLTRVKAI